MNSEDIVDHDIHANISATAPYLLAGILPREGPIPTRTTIKKMIENDAEITDIQVDLKVIKTLLAFGCSDWLQLPTL
jgi:hypothetical protein